MHLAIAVADDRAFFFVCLMIFFVAFVTKKIRSLLSTLSVGMVFEWQRCLQWRGKVTVNLIFYALFLR